MDERTDDELREMLADRLRRHPLLDEFFGPMLTNHASTGDWLNNRLTQIVLTDREVNIEIIEAILHNIRDYDGELFRQLKSELSGIENDFDGKSSDLLAELRAAESLIKCGYTSIKKVERSDRQSPDFQAVGDGKAWLFEVKNLRSPISLAELILSKLTAAQLRRPSSLPDNRYSIYSRGYDPDCDRVDSSDAVAVDRFVEELRTRIVEGSNECTIEYMSSSQGGKVCIECDWTPSEQFAVWWWPSRRSPEVNTSHQRTQLLVPLIKKTLDAIMRAVQQLTTYDADDSCEKVILLNWQVPASWIIQRESEVSFRGMVADANTLLHRVSPRLSVRLIEGELIASQDSDGEPSG